MLLYVENSNLYAVITYMCNFEEQIRLLRLGSVYNDMHDSPDMYVRFFCPH